MSYNSKYTGQEVENLLDQVKNGEVGGGSSAYPMVDHGTNDTTFELTPNVFHVWGEVTELDLTLGGEVSGVANEYLFQFVSGENTTSLVISNDIKWTNNEVPIIFENTVYQISVLNGFGCALSFEYEPPARIISFSVGNEIYQAESGMMWIDFINSDYNPIHPITTQKTFQSDGYQVSAMHAQSLVAYANTLHVSALEFIEDGGKYIYSTSGGSN